MLITATYFAPKAAAGYARSLFFREAATVELLRELPPLRDPFAAAAACISAGRSFHSVSGRKFWNDVPAGVPFIGGGGGRFADVADLGGGGTLEPFGEVEGGGGRTVPLLDGGGGGADLCAAVGGNEQSGKFAAMVVVLGGICVVKLLLL